MSEKLGRSSLDIPLGDENENTGWEKLEPIKFSNEAPRKSETRKAGDLARKAKEKIEGKLRGDDYNNLSDLEKARVDTKVATALGGAGGALVGGKFFVGAGMSGVVGGAIAGAAISRHEALKKQTELEKLAYAEKMNEMADWKKNLEEALKDEK